VSDAASHFELLAAQMADPEASWSLGTLGAIAESTATSRPISLATALISPR